MKPVETIPLKRGQAIKKNDGVVELNYNGLSLGNITMYPQ
jgi:hypothetical protein